MAVQKPDEFQHSNPTRALIDSDFTRGGRRAVPDRTALYALQNHADQLKENVTIVRVLIDSENSGNTTELLLIDDSQIGSAAGWLKRATHADLSSGGGPDTTMQFTATRTVGGIDAGTQVTVDKIASGQALKLLLAPDNGPNAALSAQNPVRQPGASTAVVLNYVATAGTNAIATIVVAGQTVTAPNGTVNATTPANTDTLFAMMVADSKGMQASANTQVVFRPLRFWGALGVDPLTLSDADLSTMLRGLSSEFSADRQQSRSIAANTEYLVFAGRASAWGGAQYEVNGLSNNAFQGKNFNYTNSEGFTESFYVVRGGQKLLGTFTATIK